jgi:chromate transport protein ChrA
LAGLLGVTVPPFFIVLLVGWWYFSPYNVPQLRSALAGCAAGAIGLTLANALELTAEQARHPVALGLIACSAFAVVILHWHLLLVLGLFGGLGMAAAVVAARKAKAA